MPISASTQYNDYHDEQAKLDAILKSPALLTVFSINCDLFSLGRVKIKDNNGEVLETHPLYDLLKNPNFFTTESQFFWDFMFWNMLGNAYLYIDSKASQENNNLYFLNSSKLDFPQEMTDNADKLFLSKRNAENFLKSSVDYIYNDGKRKPILFNKILHFNDTTSTTNAWFKGSSKIDALYKVISNSELSLDAKNIELLFTKKYMVAGKVGEADLDNPMLSPEDKKDIEHKVMSERPVTAVRKMVDIKRFVENLKSEGLDKSFMQDLFTIARMFGIPKDVIEVNIDGGAKYENQEKSRGNHVDYALKPKGDEFLNGLMKYFGFEGKAEMTWDHLPFMHFRTMQENEAKKTKAEAFRILVDSGVNPLDAQKELGYQFENEVNYVQVRNTGTRTES